MDKLLLFKEIIGKRRFWAGVLVLTVAWAVALVATVHLVRGHARQQLAEALSRVVDTLAGRAEERVARLERTLHLLGEELGSAGASGGGEADRLAARRRAAGLDGLAVLRGAGRREGAVLAADGLSAAALARCREPGAQLLLRQTPPLLVQSVAVPGRGAPRRLCGALALPGAADLALPADLAGHLRLHWRPAPVVPAAAAAPQWVEGADGARLVVRRPLRLPGAGYRLEASLAGRLEWRHVWHHLLPWLGVLTLLYGISLATFTGALLMRTMGRRWRHMRRAAFDGMAHTGNAVLVTDRHGRIQFSNRAAQALLGRDREALAGRPAAEVLRFCNRDGEDLPEPLTAACEQHREVTAGCDAWLVTGTGERVAVHYSANPILEGERVAGAVLVVRDMRKERALLEELRTRATRDEVTGLPNRAELVRRLRETLQRVQAAGGSTQLLYLDLDRFDAVNELHGLAAGDRLLAQVGGLLRSLTGPQDVVARLGGDEFAIVLEGADARAAARLADRLLQALRGHRFGLGGAQVVVTASVGIAPLNLQARDALTALTDAAAACHEAKRLGRNRWLRFASHEAVQRRRAHELRWLPRLRTALEQDEFTLYVQPIRPVPGGTATGRLGELLLRGHDPDGAPVSPREFLPVAEQYGLAEELDRWVVETLFSRFREHFSADGEFDLLTINLTRHALVSPEFLAFVTESIEQHRIDPRRVCFEVAERHLVDHREAALEFMHTLHAQGVQFMLDDFGTGMTSFGCLKDLPVGYVKINGQFVRAMEQDVGAYAMVHALNETAHFLGVHTIAEFVESATLQSLVEEIGVDYVQGFGVAVPEPLRGGRAAGASVA